LLGELLRVSVDPTDTRNTIRYATSLNRFDSPLGDLLATMPRQRCLESGPERFWIVRGEGDMPDEPRGFVEDHMRKEKRKKEEKKDRQCSLAPRQPDLICFDNRGHRLA
jgi:hypothetical protein